MQGSNFFISPYSMSVNTDSSPKQTNKQFESNCGRDNPYNCQQFRQWAAGLPVL